MSIREGKKFINRRSSDEEEAFSAEDTPTSFSSTDSEEEKRRKKKRKNQDKKKRKRNYDDSSDADDPDSSCDEKRKKKKKKSKYFSNSDSNSDEENQFKPKSKEEETRQRLEKLKSSNLKIVPLTEEEIKEKYRYRKHKCALANIETQRSIMGQELCRPGRPAELAVDKVKLHYVVHYIYRGVWDHIVPEEGEKEGKIDSYVCNACSNKRFKNYLEKREYPGRGSALCHIATDHGRLLNAMLEDEKVDMTEEIKTLAKYDKQFNDIYRAYLDHKDDSYGLKDDEIVTVKESLVWKIYLPKSETKQEQASFKSLTPPKSQGSGKEVDNEALAAVLDRPKPQKFDCPKKKETDCNFKATHDPQAFRLHFFLHYKEKWGSRFKNLTKGDKCYYCDLCPTKKPIKGATEEGARTSTICHLAIQHHELRDHMERDESLPKSFVLDVYYDVDLKKAQKAGIITEEQNNGPKTTKKATPVKKATPPKRPGPKSKTRTGPKSKTRPNGDDDEVIPNFSSSSDEKEDASPEPKMPKANANYIRKRPKIKLTMEDLEADDSDDEIWKENEKKTPNGNANGRNRRILPRRNARPQSQEKPQYSTESESD